MVEVIGTDPQYVNYTVTCKNCGSILRYKRSDEKYYTGGDPSGYGDAWTEYQIKCPTCELQVKTR